MIKGKGICKNFQGLQALDHASFQVDKGSVYGLVGPNGAGKSTLLRHIMGVFRPDSGEILVDGQPAYENNEIKQKMLWIPDDVFFFHNATISGMQKYYRGIYGKFDEKLFDKLRPCFPELDDKKAIRNMSKGMQKQAAFLLTICLKPEILLLDEPVDGLDPVIRRQVWKILLEEVSDGKMTVMVSSHNLRELEDVCDHVGIMHHGKVILEHSLTELQNNISKIQVVFDGELPDFKEAFTVLNHSNTGRIHTLIIKGNPSDIDVFVKGKNPVLYEQVPLTLEEIFIYELGGNEYEVKDIIL